MLTNGKFAKGTRALRLAGVALGATLLGACTYGGYGSYGTGYASSNYGCDPWSTYDSYYGCDSSYGFSNIGYGGGWYGDYYYPGYGQYIFDRGGSRSYMNDRYRRYWAQKRYQYLRSNRDRGDWNRGDRDRWDNDRNRGNNWNRGDRDRNDRDRGDWNRGDRDRNDRDRGDWNRGDRDNDRNDRRDRGERNDNRGSWNRNTNDRNDNRARNRGSSSQRGGILERYSRPSRD